MFFKICFVFLETNFLDVTFRCSVFKRNYIRLCLLHFCKFDFLTPENPNGCEKNFAKRVLDVLQEVCKCIGVWFDIPVITTRKTVLQT